MGSSKGNWGRYGLQAFGISVLGPLLFYLINPIIEHFKGNRDAVAYTKTYVSQWDSIKITLPNNLFEQMMQEGSIRVKTLVSDSKGKYRIVADNKIFYISQYKKYFGRIQRANALHRKVIKSFRKNTQKEYKNLIFLLVED